MRQITAGALAALGLFCFLSLPSAKADAIFSTGYGGLANEQLIFPACSACSAGGTAFGGSTSISATSVDLQTNQGNILSRPLLNQSPADIVGINGNGFQNLGIQVVSAPIGYTDATFDIHSAVATTGNFTFNEAFSDKAGTFNSSASFALSAGDNFFNFHAPGDEIIMLATFDTVAAVSEFNELLIGGFTAPFPVAAPETSTWAMLLIGFAGIGFAGYFRRRFDAISKCGEGQAITRIQGV